MKKNWIIIIAFLGVLVESQIVFSKSFSNGGGGIAISNSRVIYNAGDREADFLIKNKSDKLKFIQLWVDDGNVKATAANSSPNFFINPPLFRLKPKTGKTSRIFFVQTKKALPKDKETLFWFNIVAIPSSTPAEHKKEDKKLKTGRVIKVAQRTRLKMFYRPTSLKDGASDAVEKLKWSYSKSNNEVVVTNPTGFYINNLNINISNFSNKIVSFTKKSDMIKPFGSKTYSLNKIKKVLPPYKNIQLKWINDRGTVSSTSFTLNMQ